MLARCQFLKIVELFFLEVSVSGLEFEVKRYKYVMVKYSKAIRCLRLYYCYTEKCPCFGTYSFENEGPVMTCAAFSEVVHRIIIVCVCTKRKRMQ